MPVIAQIMIPVEFNENGIVEILKEEINRCGCLDLVVESGRLDTPVDRLLKAMRSIDGVVCNDVGVCCGVCCATDIAGFANKLKKFRRES